MSGRPKPTQGHDLLRGARVVLVAPRFPENIGMAARACANMGLGSLCLVAPELWAAEHQAKALSLATPQGEPLLREAILAASLSEAVADCHLVLGATARTGGWRRRILAPQAAGAKIVAGLAGGAKVALVFGPEDRGLINEEIELCTALVTIPTAPGASSLNLAQAVLIMAYECLRAAQDLPAASTGQHLPPTQRAGAAQAQKPISHAEQELLFAAMGRVLKAIDFLPQDNSDYFLLPLREFVHSRPLKRGEFSMLMGICRQVLWAVGPQARARARDDNAGRENH